MSTYRLFRLAPTDPTVGELIDSHEKESSIAKTVFRRWPIAVCLPTEIQYGERKGDVFMTVWENKDDADHKRTPVAIVRTFPNQKLGFTREIWKTPVSA